MDMDNLQQYQPVAITTDNMMRFYCSLISLHVQIRKNMFDFLHFQTKGKFHTELIKAFIMKSNSFLKNKKKYNTRMLLSKSFQLQDNQPVLWKTVGN